jgi:hypothetical protein
MRVHPGFAVLLLSLAVAACTEEDPVRTVPRPANPVTTGAGGVGGDGGASASSAADSGSGGAPVCLGTDPVPGCPCQTDGELYDCGQVYSMVGSQIVCGPGRMSCAGGVWGECVLSNIPL